MKELKLRGIYKKINSYMQYTHCIDRMIFTKHKDYLRVLTILPTSEPSSIHTDIKSFVNSKIENLELDLKFFKTLKGDLQ